MTFPATRTSWLRKSFLPLILLLTIASCGKKQRLVTIDPGFARYISSYTSGVISKTAAIRIQLAGDTKVTHPLGKTDESLFNFSPSVKGQTSWIDARTIEFRPDKPLSPGDLYTISFNLGKVTDVPDKFRTFRFNAEILPPSFVVREDGLRSNGDKENMFLPGAIETADNETASDIEKILSATQGTNKLKIQWQHAGSSRTHLYTVEGIKKDSAGSEVILKWDGKSLKSKYQGEQKIAVPALGDFTLLDARAIDDNGQYISMLFSDAISVTQDLSGLLSVADAGQVTHSINGSEVRLYLAETPEGSYTVNVNAGIQNKFDQALGKDFVSTVFFGSQKPSVSIVGKGNILPHKGKLTLPFTSINLNAVDVSIVKIYENNIPQFLQDNDMGGNDGLRRVAVPLVQQTIRLDDDKSLDLHKRQRFSLDIDKYLQTEPGAVYNITIGFRPEYSLYDCSASSTSTEADDGEEEAFFNTSFSPDNYQDFWDRYNNYYPFGYDWSHRDNPCYSAYYNKERFESRNILASNIGIIAQKGAANQLTLIITDLLTANPLNGAIIKVLDYQHQTIGSTKSDESGFATIDLSAKPYLVIVSTVNEKGYLKVDDGSSLPLSRFNIAGEEVRNGIKGFLFAERGVWRPGDSLFIGFIERNQHANLPADHPIEFELYNPLGQLQKKLVQKNDNGGFNIFKMNTDENALTGNWRAKVKVGGAVFEKTIKIETVMPNRLKVEMNFNGDTILGKNQSNEGTLTSSWLFGAPAKDLRATVDLTLFKLSGIFPQHKGFVFVNPLSKSKTEAYNIFSGNLSADGTARVKFNIQTPEDASGLMKANLLMKVFEPGGAFSIRTQSLTYSPYASYAGLKVPEGEKPWGFLSTGKTHVVQILDVDTKGTPTSGKRQMEVSFYKIQWRWWWDQSGDEFSNFTQDKYNKLLKKETLDIENGKGSWRFSVPQNDWGRYLILVKDLQSGHTAGDAIYIDDPGWQSRENFDDPTAASMLSFTANKDKYRPGEDITLSIPGSSEGKGLITISSGSNVLKSWWVDTKAGQTQVTFKAEKTWAPNVYASVSLLQPYAQTINDLPMRMYGVIPILIENPETVLTPVIQMPSVIRPEQQVSITVSEKNNREMWYSIAIVDEGLLDLTNFRTPDPHSYFMAKEALSVKTWDLYDYVIGAWGENIERILTIGGDQEGVGRGQQKGANRFPPVVKFLGPFKLSKGKQIQHFTLPQYLGSVRVMVVAAAGNAFGNAEKTVQVKKPLMMLATVPRVLSPGERIKLPVTVFATEKTMQSVNVRLQTNGLFETKSSPSQQIHFSEPGEQTIFFDVSVKGTTGIGKVALTANSGNEKADYNTELNIRNANPFVVNVASGTIEGNKSWKNIIAPIGEFTSNESTIEISSIPSIGLQKRLDFLIDYPHGCAEQITSRAFAQLYLNQLSDLSKSQSAQVEKNINAAIRSLNNFQAPDGGFSYWPGSRGSDDWSTSYVGHFLLLAKDAGYFVSDQTMQQWKIYQKNKANNWAPSTRQFYGADLTQAYRLYVLALARSSELGAMNRLKAFKYISPEARWRLAATYQITGHPDVANSLISGLSATFGKRASPGVTYGSDLRDESMVLETLTLMDKRTIASPLVNKIAAQLAENEWYSTQTTAYALLALAEFAGKNKSDQKITARVTINGRDTTISSQSYITRIPVRVNASGASIVVLNKGENTLFVKSITKGQPLTGQQTTLANNPSLLRMQTTYMTKDKKPLDIANLPQGADFVIKVSVTNPGNLATYRRMALTQIMPSGWEILNTRLFDLGGAFNSSPVQYRDIRDDRVYTYFDLNPNETKTFYLQITAAYTGTFFMPAVICNSMYDENIQAAKEGGWVTVSGLQENKK